MDREEAMKIFRSLQMEALRLEKYGYTEESSKLHSVMDSISKSTGYSVPNFCKRDIEKTQKLLKGMYLMSGRKDGMICKKDVRDFVKNELGKSEALASRFVTDRPGYWLYRALLFKLVETVEEGELWKIKIDV